MAIARRIHELLTERGETLALAESCTGGAISARFVSMEGASKYLLGSLVVYSNRWKEEFLRVSPETIAREGAVSSATVREMAEGLLVETEADYVVAVSGRIGAPYSDIFIAVGKRGSELKIEQISAPAARQAGIDAAVEAALHALLRQIA